MRRRSLLLALAALPLAVQAQPMAMATAVLPQAPEQPGPVWALAAVLATCWQQRDARFSQSQIVTRLGNSPLADLPGVMEGLATSVDGQAWLTSLRRLLPQAIPPADRWARVGWAADVAHLLGRLGDGAPMLLLDRSGGAWLLVGVAVVGAPKASGLRFTALRPGDNQQRQFDDRDVAMLLEPVAQPAPVAG